MGIPWCWLHVVCRLVASPGGYQASHRSLWVSQGRVPSAMCMRAVGCCARDPSALANLLGSPFRPRRRPTSPIRASWTSRTSQHWTFVIDRRLQITLFKCSRFYLALSRPELGTLPVGYAVLQQQHSYLSGRSRKCRNDACHSGPDCASLGLSQFICHQSTESSPAASNNPPQVGNPARQAIYPRSATKRQRRPQPPRFICFLQPRREDQRSPVRHQPPSPCLICKIPAARPPGPLPSPDAVSKKPQHQPSRSSPRAYLSTASFASPPRSTPKS